MPYTPFDQTKPDAATQNGTAFGASIRNNLNAIRDACIMGGGFPGFNMSKSGGTAAEPAQILYSKGTERVRATLTWSGGLVTQAVYAYSSNSGGSYDTIGTVTLTWDGSNYLTSTTWS